MGTVRAPKREALGLQVTISKVPWLVWSSGWDADATNHEHKAAPMHGSTEQQAARRTQTVENQLMLSPSSISKAKGWGLLCAAEHIISFCSFGNLPRTYSRESKESRSPVCSGFQSSHTRKFYMFWASEKQLKVPAAGDIGAIELLIMLFTLRPVGHQAIWLILCFQLISKLYSEVKCCDSWHDRWERQVKREKLI